jgi:hypothetical protein
LHLISVVIYEKALEGDRLVVVAACWWLVCNLRKEEDGQLLLGRVGFNCRERNGPTALMRSMAVKVDLIHASTTFVGRLESILGNRLGDKYVHLARIQFHNILHTFSRKETIFFSCFYNLFIIFIHEARDRPNKAHFRVIQAQLSFWKSNKERRHLANSLRIDLLP